MAGIYLQPALFGFRPDEPADRDNRTATGEVYAGLARVGQTRGLATDNQPTDRGAQTTTGGVYSASFRDDFYNRLYFIPLIGELGQITSDRDFTFTVWNAYFDDTTLNSIDGSGDIGVSFGNVTLPLVLPELATVEITLDALEAGPLDFNEPFTFTFDRAAVGYTISGQRSRLLPFRPNWRNGYKEARIYRTDIITSRNGKEQRRATRVKPRRTIEFTAHPLPGELPRLNRLFHKTGSDRLTVADLPRKAVLSLAVLPGSSTAAFTTVPDWIAPAVPVVMAHKDQSEGRTVSAVVGNIVSFTQPSKIGYPVGAKLHPALLARFDPTVATRRLTNTFAEHSIDLAVEPLSEPTPTPPAAETVFADREVLTLKNNWATLPTVEFDMPRETVDYGRGAISVFEPIPYVMRRMKLGFSGGYGHLAAVRDFFDRMRGQQGEFWRSSGEFDLTPIVYGDDSGFTMTVPKWDTFKAYSEDATHRAVEIALKDGTRLYRLIENMEEITDENGAVTVFTFTEAYPGPVFPTDVARVSWLHLYRLSTDTLSLDWLTDEVGKTELNLQTIEVR